MQYDRTSERFGQIVEISASNSATNCRSDQELINNNIILCTYYGYYESTESSDVDQDSTSVSSSEVCNSATRDHDH
jgi:hypothetical protein